MAQNFCNQKKCIKISALFLCGLVAYKVVCEKRNCALDLKNKTDFHFPKVRFCYQSIISPSTAQLCVFVTLTLCIVPISDSSPFTSVMMNSPLLPLISPSL